MISPAIDPVTGTLPRAVLDPQLQEALARGGNCGLFLFDVDFFKTVNDVYGHQRGDEVLRQLADRVDGVLRSTDTCSGTAATSSWCCCRTPTGKRRYGWPCGWSMRSARSSSPATRRCTCPISLGVAMYPGDGTQVDTLLAAADRRNYLAKRRGRGIAVADDAEAPA